MADVSNDLILSVLRQVQADISDMKRDISEIRTDVRNVDQKVDGLTVMLALLAGHVHHVEQRVEALESNRS